MSIKILDSITASKIAAGEVITDPKAVVKELLENAIDAKSTVIDIEILDGGKKTIRVSDNGTGIPVEEIPLAFKRHATSKIAHLEDLTLLDTLGFRGEALASIAAISKVKMKTNYYREDIGSKVLLYDDNIEIEHKSFQKGTTIIVQDVFYNTPARLKHLKKSSDLSREIINLVQNMALSHCEISFSLMNEGRLILKTPGDKMLLNCIYTIYGKAFVENLVPIHYENKPLIITGFIGKPIYTKSTRLYQYITVNHRLIQDKHIAKAIEEAYENTIMINKYPIFFLNIDIPPQMLDVNIHPSKTKIRMFNESLILLLIKDGVRKAIRDNGIVKIIDTEKYQKNDSDNEIYIEKEEQQFIEYTSHKNENKIEQISESVEQYKDTKIMENKNQQWHDVNNDFLDLFKNTKLIGQIFNTYILFEGKDYVLLIDQHAAHERVLYEDLQLKYQKGEKVGQQIFPTNVQVSPKEYQILINERQVFENLGFEYDEFGNNTICLRGVPVFFNIPQNHNLLLSIIEEMQDKVNLGNPSMLEDRVILTACKKAVKGNYNLSNREIDYLIDQLSFCEYPFSCPHGRPTILKMTKYEFEKQFKRIQ